MKLIRHHSKCMLIISLFFFRLKILVVIQHCSKSVAFHLKCFTKASSVGCANYIVISSNKKENFYTMTEIKSTIKEQNATQQHGALDTVHSTSLHQNNSSATANAKKHLKKQTSAFDNIAFHLGIKKTDNDQVDDRNLFVTLLRKLNVSV